MFYPRLYHCHLSTWKLFQLLNPSHFLNIITFLCRFRNNILKGKTPNPPISCHFTYKKLMNMLKSEKKIRLECSKLQFLMLMCDFFHVQPFQENCFQVLYGGLYLFQSFQQLWKIHIPYPQVLLRAHGARIPVGN